MFCKSPLRKLKIICLVLDMLSLANILWLMSLITEHLSGILLNIFIVVVSILDWNKRRCLKSYEYIFLVIGVSRVCQQSTYRVYNVLFNLNLVPVSHYELFVMLSFFCLFFNFSSFWFTALLYVYYCVTVANFHHPLFTLLKVRIPQLMPWLLLGCTAASMVTTLPSPWMLPEVSNLAVNHLGNTSVNNNTEEKLYFKPILYYTFGCSLPFLIFCVSASLLIASLFRHTRRMEHSFTDFSSPRLEALYRAVKSMLGFFLIFAIYFTAALCRICFTFLYNDFTFVLVTDIVIAAYPTVHSAMIFMIHSKFSKVAMGILRHVQCWKTRAASEVET